MYTTTASFLADHAEDCAEMQKNFDALTDSALQTKAAPNHWTLGQLAAHNINAWEGVLKQAGHDISFSRLPDSASAAELAQGFRNATEAVQQHVREQWTDATLAEPVNMWGMDWTKAKVLYEMLKHTVHHHGQMTMLMRQAGLKVHGVYGPSLEESGGA